MQKPFATGNLFKMINLLAIIIAYLLKNEIFN